jgi:hypothetical protein
MQNVNRISGSRSKIRKITLISVCLVIMNHGFSQEKDDLSKDWEKMYDAKSAIFKDYNDLKFGMFIHWGVYSKLGGTWKGEKIVSETHGLCIVHIYHGQNTAKLPKRSILLVLMQKNG